MSTQFPDLDEDVPELSASALKRRLDAGERVTLLDTRWPADFAEWQITHPNLRAVNVPFTEFLDDGDPAATVPDSVPREPLVTSCARGISSRFVAQVLARDGWEVTALADGMAGWARLYEALEVPIEATTTVQYHRPSSGCLSYLLVADGEAALVDPLRAFTDRYRKDLRERGVDLRYAIDTHVHADHVSGVRRLVDETGAEAVLPEGAADRGLAFDARLLADGDELPLGETALSAVALPGHTTELTGILVGDVLCSADTVFLDSVARPDLEDPTGARRAAERLYETVQEILAMPDDRRIAPGHASPTVRPRADGTYTERIGRLRETVELLSYPRAEFVEFVLSDLPPEPKGYETIIPTNLGRESIGDEEAFELELGPNNCAVE